jgi:hypothetical protein
MKFNKKGNKLQNYLHKSNFEVINIFLCKFNYYIIIINFIKKLLLIEKFDFIKANF